MLGEPSVGTIQRLLREQEVYEKLLTVSANLESASADLSDVAAELKAHGKTLAGNVVVKERRQSPSGAHMPVTYLHETD